jgi:multicomponent Na+:H+ antiporter subunit B
MSIPIEPILFLFLIVTAVAIGQMRDLFAAAMLSGIFSLLCAGLFTLMDAVDVAFTEAAVGAGISTVLLLGTLSLTSSQENQRAIRVLPFVVVVLTGAALFVGTLDMPMYGDPSAVIHHHVVPEYIKGTKEEFGLPNIVTAVLASYRGYDTLGETAVIFTAAVGVMLMLVSGGREPESGGEE